MLRFEAADAKNATTSDKKGVSSCSNTIVKSFLLV